MTIAPFAFATFAFAVVDGLVTAFVVDFEDEVFAAFTICFRTDVFLPLDELEEDFFELLELFLLEELELLELPLDAVDLELVTVCCTFTVATFTIRIFCSMMLARSAVDVV